MPDYDSDIGHVKVPEVLEELAYLGLVRSLLSPESSWRPPGPRSDVGFAMRMPGRELPPSVMSLPIAVCRRRLGATEDLIILSEATGFLVRYQDSVYLVTNWHVVTGRSPVTGEPLGATSALPDSIRVRFPVFLGGTLYWTEQSLELYDLSGNASWYAHAHCPPREGGTDVIILPITTDPPSTYAYAFVEAVDVTSIQPGMELSIVGYPFGVETGAAVWSRASVASEPSHGFKDDPIYLVDTRSRPGQSGSPVLWAERQSPERSSDAQALQWRLAGIYAGRVDSELDLGRVWWPVVIEEIIRHNTRDTLRFE